MVKKIARPARKASKKRGGNPNGVVTRRGNADAMSRLDRHIRLLLDPCNADIGPTAYRGRDGFITRFTSIHTVGPGTTQTVGIFMYYPRLNRVYNRMTTNINDELGAIDWFGANTFDGPGHPFLRNTVEAMRPVSACVQAYFSGTELDRQGVVYNGVVPAQVFTNTALGMNTIDGYAQLLQKRQRTPDHTVETKWVPSPSDENYARTDTLSPQVESDNVIVLCYTGFAPTKINFNFRVVNNVEWLPGAGQGFVAPAPSTPDVPAGLERVRTALSHMGNWWVEAAHTVQTAAGVARQVYSATRSVASIAGPRLPMLLTL